MAIRSLGRALTCAAALLVLVAAATSNASVTVTDGALTPRVVVIPAGGSVLWTNRGTKQHQIQIVAQRHAFPAFSLAPGGARRVAFARPGRYPYLLDSVVTGMVYVTAAGAPSGPVATSEPSVGPSSGRAGCGHPTIYRYDVRVAVHRQATDSASTSTLSDWKAGWIAPMSVERCGAVTVTIAGAAPSKDELHGGGSDITFTWDQGDCHVTVARKFGAVMAIQDGISLRFDGTGGQFDFLFAIEDHGGLMSALTDTKHQACSDQDRPVGFMPVYKDLDVNGIKVMASDTNLVLFYSMPPRTAVGAAILRALASGKGFNFDTGEQVMTFPSLTSRSRATVSFSRLLK